MPVPVIRNRIADRLLNWSFQAAYDKSPRSITERGLLAPDAGLSLSPAGTTSTCGPSKSTCATTLRPLPQNGQDQAPAHSDSTKPQTTARLTKAAGGIPPRFLPFCCQYARQLLPIAPQMYAHGLRSEISAQKKGSRTNRKPLIFMVPGARLELARCCHRRILSPLRLPIPPSRRSRRPEAHKAFRDYRG